MVPPRTPVEGVQPYVYTSSRNCSMYRKAWQRCKSKWVIQKGA